MISGFNYVIENGLKSILTSFFKMTARLFNLWTSRRGLVEYGNKSIESNDPSTYRT